jgi:hypothetical protein
LESTYTYSFDNKYLLRPSNNFTCFAAAVNLPQGAAMTDIAAWYQNLGGTLTMRLMKTEGVGTAVKIESRGLPDTGASYKSANKTINPRAVVDNQRGTYWIEYCANNGVNTWLIRMRITYTYQNAGD